MLYRIYSTACMRSFNNNNSVDGSCAKHLTVESYMAIYAANSYTLLLVFHHLLFHSRLKTFLFCESFPLQPFLFFFGADNMIPQTFTVTSSILLFSFSVLQFYLSFPCGRLS